VNRSRLCCNFAVPGNAAPLGVVIAREGDFGFPRCWILGQGRIRKPPIVYVARR